MPPVSAESRNWPSEGLARVPYWIYRDEAIYRSEQERIFRGATWNFLGLEAELPRLLWLYQMGVLYFWMLDSSPGRLRTLEVVDETTDLIVRVLALANLPPLRKSRQRILALARAIAEEPLS